MDSQGQARLKGDQESTCIRELVSLVYGLIGRVQKMRKEIKVTDSSALLLQSSDDFSLVSVWGIHPSEINLRRRQNM